MKSSNIMRYLSTNSEVKSCFKKSSTIFLDVSAAIISSESFITSIFATIANSCIRALRILSLILISFKMNIPKNYTAQFIFHKESKFMHLFCNKI